MQGILVGMQKDSYVGDEARSKRCLDVEVSQSWRTGMTWRRSGTTDSAASVAPKSTLCSEAPRNPEAHRERMTQIMFKTFNMPTIFVAIQVVLSLFGSARTTGAVMDSCDAVSDTVPIYEGYVLPHPHPPSGFGRSSQSNW